MIGTIPLHAADMLAGSYFKLASNDPDRGVGEGNAGNSFISSIGNGLGPNGLPVLNATGRSILHDFNSTTGELDWWTTAYSGIMDLNNPVFTPTITLPYVNDHMYVNSTVFNTNGDDSSGFLTARFTGNFAVPGTANVTFNACSDDDELVYLSGGSFGAGTLVLDNGGIHPTSCTGPNVNQNLLSNVAAGNYTLTVFYADRQATGAAFELSSNLGLVPPSSVPEPASLVMVGLGLAALGSSQLRRRNK